MQHVQIEIAALSLSLLTSAKGKYGFGGLA